MDRQRSLGIVVALLLAGCALVACDEDQGSTADQGSGAAAGAPPEGRYVGETSQGLPISFVVVGRAVRDLNFGWRARCEDGLVHSNTIALPGGQIQEDEFSSGGPLETGGIARVDGRFDGPSVSGELSRDRGSAFGTDCRATGIEWSADLQSQAAPDAAAL